MKQDKYYKFSTGKIIKYSANGLFYYLDKDGNWILDGQLMAKFFDAASDYIEIENPNQELENNYGKIK